MHLYNGYSVFAWFPTSMAILYATAALHVSLLKTSVKLYRKLVHFTRNCVLCYSSISAHDQRCGLSS